MKLGWSVTHLCVIPVPSRTAVWFRYEARCILILVVSQFTFTLHICRMNLLVSALDDGSA